MKLHTFCTLLFGKVPIWNIDIDRSAKTGLLFKLANLTGVPLDRVKQTVLKKYLGFLFETYSAVGALHWILPVGSYHRMHLSYGQNFCPECLSMQPDPYYKTIWRVGVLPVCLEHQCVLLDACRECGMPVNFNRSEFLDRSVVSAKPIHLCYACGANFCEQRSAKVDMSALPFFKKINTTLKRGWINIGEYKNVYSFQFFEVLRQMVRLITLTRDHHSLKRWTDNMKYINYTSYAKSVEMLRVTTRCDALMEIKNLFLRWPEKFLKIMEAYGVTYSILLRDRRDLPFWFQYPMKERLKVEIRQLSASEIMFAERYLKQSGKHVNNSNLNKVLGFRDSKILKRYLRKICI